MKFDELHAMTVRIVDEATQDDVASLFEACRTRQKILRERQDMEILVTVKPGDRVRFNAGASPQYLRGVGAVVVKIANKKVVIDVDDDPRAKKYKGSKAVKCPPAILEVVT